MALYSDNVMDHFMHPRNVGEIENADGVGEVGNAKCGDIMKMYLKIKDDVITGREVRDLRLRQRHRLLLHGHRDDQGQDHRRGPGRHQPGQVVEALGGLPAHKLHCSVLAEEAIKSAVKDYYDRHGIEYDHSRFPEDCGSCESCRMV